MNKLWVVGEDNGNAEDWSIWSEIGLVIAGTKEEAIILDGRGNTKACEVDMNKNQVLVQMDVPDDGADL